MRSSIAYARALDTLYAACQDPVLWPTALTAAADYVGAIGGILVRNSLPGQPGQIIGGRVCDVLNRSYITSYSDNLWTRAVRAANVAGPIIASSLVAERDLIRTACYADIIRPHGAIDMAFLGVAPLSQGNGVGGFGFPLTRRQSDGAHAVEQRLARLSPHLHRAFTLSLELSRVDAGRRTLSSMLEGIGTSAIVLDSAARVLFVNTAAERMLARNRGLGIDADRRLKATTAASNRRLVNQVRAAMEMVDIDQGRQVLRLPNPEHVTPLTLLVSPLPRPAFVLARDLDEARIMILVLGDQPVAAEALTRDVFDFSPTEARVATLVAAGKSRPEIARALGISVETVKTHLQRSFFKTGTHSQGEMARLLLQLPVKNDGDGPSSS